MNNHILKKIEKQTNNKHLNLYLATYDTEKGDFVYEFASRNSENNLIAKNENVFSNAVRVVPYYFDDNKNVFVVLIKEFRYALNRYIYGVPAGLVDAGETEDEAIKREITEEIGATAIKVVKTENVSFSSAGLSDETIMCFEAEVKLDQKQRLDGSEDITIKIVSLDELNEMLNKETFGLQSRLQLRSFYFKCKYEKERNK